MTEIDVWKIPNMVAINSPTINKAVAKMRPELNLGAGEFYKLWIKVARELFVEIINGDRRNVALVAIMRAAAPLVPCEVFERGVPVSYAWTKRDEESHIAKILNWDPPKNIPDGWELEVFDPMIASGTSLEQIFRKIRSQNIKRIRATAGIASPEGLFYLTNLCREIGLEVEFTVGYTGNNVKLDERSKYDVYRWGPFANQQIAGDVGDRLTNMDGAGNILYANTCPLP